MTLIKIKNTISIYSLGVALWLVVIAMLQMFCIVNIPQMVDRLWTKPVGKGFSKNILGTLSFQPISNACHQQLIYSTSYYPEGMTGGYTAKAIDSLVDIDSWNIIASDSASTTYTDKNYKYMVYRTSDGVYMRIFNL